MNVPIEALDDSFQIVFWKLESFEKENLKFIIPDREISEQFFPPSK